MTPPTLTQPTTRRSLDLVDGVAATLGRFEAAVATTTAPSAARRLETFRRTLARALHEAHLETVQELGSGDDG